MKLKEVFIGFAVGSWVLLAACASSPRTSPERRAELFFDLANGSFQEGDWVGALEALQKAEDANPKFAELHHLRALIFYKRKELDPAVTSARKAIELKPNYSEAKNTLGKLLLDQGKRSEAIAYLDQAGQDPLYRDAYKAHTLLGVHYFQAGDLAMASRSLNRAIDLSPEVACIAKYYLGHIQVEEKKFSEAMKQYEAASKGVCAEFADAHLAMGQTLEKSRQFDAARKKYVEIQTRYPHSLAAEKAVQHLRNLP